MSWQQSLRKAIASKSYSDFQGNPAVLDVIFDCTQDVAYQMRTRIGHVNAAPLAGFSRGLVLFNAMSTDGVGHGSLSFSVRRHVEWNRTWNNDSLEYVDIKGADGSRPYPYDEFDVDGD